jgi:hypothetical protein
VTGWIDDNGRGVTLISFTIGGVVLFAIGWIAGWPVRGSTKDFVLWTASGSVYGALIGLGAYLFAFLRPYADPSDFKLCCDISTQGML